MHALHLSFYGLSVIWIIAVVVGKLKYLNGKENIQSSALSGIAIGCVLTALYALDSLERAGMVAPTIRWSLSGLILAGLAADRVAVAIRPQRQETQPVATALPYVSEIDRTSSPVLWLD
jgi:hypothetical protein